MSKRHGRFLGVELSNNLWFVPLFVSSGAVLLCVATLLIDSAAAAGQVPLPSWLSTGGADDARALLGSLISAVSAVLALIFSLTLLVLSIAESQLGPRLLHRFVRDPLMHATLGLFTATFLFCLLALVALREQDGQRFIPQLTLCTSVVLVIVSFILLVAYSHKVAMSIQANNVIADIVADLTGAITEYGRAGSIVSRSRARTAVARQDRQPEALAVRCVKEGGKVLATSTGYIQRVDHQWLGKTAEKANVVICLIHRPGQFVLTGEVLGYVLPAQQQDGVARVFSRAIKIGFHRTLEQDLEFGIAQLVEIALRALSPAVNDTFTGIACIDWLGDMLRNLAALPPSAGDWRTAEGEIRLLEPPLRFPRAVKAAFDQIRQSGQGNPAIQVRLLHVCACLGMQLHRNEDRQALRSQVDSVWQMVEQSSTGLSDRRDIESAYRQAMEALTADPPT